MTTLSASDEKIAQIEDEFNVQRVIGCVCGSIIIILMVTSGRLAYSAWAAGWEAPNLPGLSIVIMVFAVLTGPAVMCMTDQHSQMLREVRRMKLLLQ